MEPVTNRQVVKNVIHDTLDELAQGEISFEQARSIIIDAVNQMCDEICAVLEKVKNV